VDGIFAELGASTLDDEVAFVGGCRRVPFAVERPAVSRNK
jgi:hypothetical protein